MVNLVFAIFANYIVLVIFTDNGVICCPSGCVCNEHSLKVKCTGPTITKFPDGLPTDTTRLEVHDSNITQIPANALSKLVNLKKLIMLGNEQLPSLPTGLFNNLTKLETISIRYGNISTIPSSLFHNLPNLRNIYLNKNRMKVIPGAAFRNLPKLEFLEFRNNIISSLPADLFDNTVSNVRYLDLEGNQLSDLPDDILRPVSKTLDSLLLRKNKFTQMPMEALKTTEKLTDIKVDGNLLYCDCTLKEFSDWAKKPDEVDVTCSNGATMKLSSVNLTHCDQLSSTQMPTTVRTTTKKPPETTKMPSTTKKLLTTLVQTIGGSSTHKNSGDPGAQDTDEQDNGNRKTLILAISISAVALVVVVAFILCLFHTGILSSRCHGRFDKSKVVILDPEGNVLVKDGRVIS